MRQLYLISGLGADQRVFDFIDLSGFELNHIKWIKPVGKESIEQYATRLLPQIKTKRPIIIGVSFGGMVSIEIAKQIETERVIIISSAKTKSDIPFYYRITGKLRVNKVIPTKVFKMVNRLTYWFFGVKTSEEKKLLKTIIIETDDYFLRWAINCIVNWRNTIILSNLIHIHGTEDKILPLKNADYKIDRAGHFMIVNKAREISDLIHLAFR